MQPSGTVTLVPHVATLSDVFAFILNEATGKCVLNVGAVGGIEGYLPGGREEWLHHRLCNVAREIVGIDIDKVGIAYAAKYGVEITEANCEAMDLDRRFDVIVMSDVIEHLNAPARALQVLMRHLNHGGRLVITTPNPTDLGSVLRAILGRDMSVYYDHSVCFMPEHIQAMCNRFGYRLSGVYFFGHVDRRSRATTLKSYVGRLAGRLSRRLHASFLAVIEE